MHLRVTFLLQGTQEGMVIGMVSTEDCPDVAEKMLQYINSMLPPLLDSSSGTNDTASSSLAPPLLDHVNSPLSSPASKSLPQGLLSHMTSSSSQFSDHVIKPPRFSADHMIPKLPPLPNPTSNHDKYVNVAMTIFMSSCVFFCSHDDEVD